MRFTPQGSAPQNELLNIPPHILTKPRAPQLNPPPTFQTPAAHPHSTSPNKLRALHSTQQHRKLLNNNQLTLFLGTSRLRIPQLCDENRQRACLSTTADPT
ncbi:hypothetical protein M758_10G128100 [Ceratodon purpureus]|uniref:Uncharacterized protein n=1 Tax=Ceratodon purpureus TaxID=3225 RepID=A0A8T0GMP5_CERPU|nr:hypothetical protein KC19_10G133600 [Ceratodon purpureus]KAG0603886.1 hypothetical protein M758_10G128100 [Ceratodon purpureus]